MKREIMIGLAMVTGASIVLCAAAQAPEEPPPAQRPKAPQAGDEAPNFTIKSLKGDETFELAAFRGKRPVILFFGSYT